IYRADTAGDKIYRASLNTSSGELAEHGALDVAPCGPVSLAVSNDKKYLFVACTDTDTIDTYLLDQTTGEPELVKSNATATDPISPILKIVADPLDRFLWSLEGKVNEGHVVNYLLAPDGSLTWASHENLGDTGKDIVVSDDGENL